MKRGHPILLLISLFLAHAAISCANEQNLRTISMSKIGQSITKEKAVEIAKQKMQKEKLDKDYNISRPKVYYETETIWGVKFYPKFSFLKIAPYLKYLVCVDKRTGEITGFGEDK